MNIGKISKIILITLVLGLVISALVSITYALFSYDIYAPNPEDFSTGYLSIDTQSESGEISLTNALPIIDEEGMESKPYIFTIKNTGNLDYIFDIQLLPNDNSTSNIAPQYIKIQVDDGEVTTLYDVENKIKSDVMLPVGQSITISIRAWLSIDESNSFYNTPNSEIGKKFDSEIVIDGRATYASTNN